MRWENRRRSDNIEDRRGGGLLRGGGMRRIPGIRIPSGGSAGGARRAGGGSIFLIIVIAVGLWAFAGINPLQLLDMLARQDGSVVVGSPSTSTPTQQAGNDSQSAFVGVVLAETEDTWGRIFQANGGTYTEPRLVLYDGSVQSACGLSSAATGPFYCPNDRKVYLDLSFFGLMSQRLGAPGDFAQAYVIAHEIGHHVQNLTGVLGRYHQARQSMSEAAANRESIKVELQADCYAGIWAHAADDIGILEEGDIQEALNAASAVGDDMLQRRQQGYVVPESFNHGTSAQRARWFETGYRSGNPADCDTFSPATL
ncbi:KPN_02809 family neutral zinc metallopeptidase [Acuticoccus mangrovi]|uniref:Zinc metallopeptidase n=1 Tax=Acuticoccus mangrovi TaxID=2796142 RepID=A0A934IHB7_9HYPH|nr:neutral zinc metallopeptidase [Acuticoccus mangrovi]MBJ3774991.1 zinc metallopeptidase [Acuticoccus mangrovi]